MHVENHLDLETIRHNTLAYAQKIAGVYCLINGNQIVYIGQTFNLFSRLVQHRPKHWDSFAIYPCEDAKLRLQKEREAILKYCPPYNAGAWQVGAMDVIRKNKLGPIFGLRTPSVNRMLKAWPMPIAHTHCGILYYDRHTAYEWANLHYGVSLPS